MLGAPLPGSRETYHNAPPPSSLFLPLPPFLHHLELGNCYGRLGHCANDLMGMETLPYYCPPGFCFE